MVAGLDEQTDTTDLQDPQLADLQQGVEASWIALLTLEKGPARFFELRDGISGISEKMLSSTLQELAKNGLIRREQTKDIPPKV